MAADEKLKQFFNELVADIRNKAIDDVLKILNKYDVPLNYDANCEILQLKESD